MENKTDEKSRQWLDENGQLQNRELCETDENNLTTPTSLLQRSSSVRPTSYRQTDSRLSHSVSRQQQAQSITNSRSLRGSSPLSRLYSASVNSRRNSRSQVNNASIRRDLELNDEQQRLRQSRLLESLFELTGGNSVNMKMTRPRSGSTGATERRIIKPLGVTDNDDWTNPAIEALSGMRANRIIAAPSPARNTQHHQQQQLLRHQPLLNCAINNIPAVPLANTTTTTTAALSSSASSSSSVTNSSSNGTTTSATNNHLAVAPSSSGSLLVR